MSKSILLIGVGWLGNQLFKDLSETGFSIGVCSRDYKKLREFDDSIPQYLVRTNKDSYQFSSINLQIESLSNYSHCIICLPPYAGLKGHLSSILKQLNRNTTIIFCSSIGIYKNKESINEESEVEKDHKLFEPENIIKNSRHVILRLGGLIGPKRHPIYSIIKHDGKVSRNEHINLVHSYDILAFVRDLIRSNIYNKTYNLVNPYHPLKAHYYNEASEKLLGRKIEIKEGGIKKIVDGQRIVEELDKPYHFSIDNWNSFSANNN
jgi:hypothetical protein